MAVVSFLANKRRNVFCSNKRLGLVQSLRWKSFRPELFKIPQDRQMEVDADIAVVLDLHLRGYKARLPPRRVALRRPPSERLHQLDPAGGQGTDLLRPLKPGSNLR